MYIFDKLQILRSRIAVRYLCCALVAANIQVLRPSSATVAAVILDASAVDDVVIIKAVIPAATATYFAAAVAFADVDGISALMATLC